MKLFTGEIKTSRSVLICMFTAIIAAGCFYVPYLAFIIWLIPIPAFCLLFSDISFKKAIGLSSAFVFTFYFVSYMVGFTIDVGFSKPVMLLIDLAIICAASILQGVPQLIALVAGVRLKVPACARALAIAAFWTFGEWLTTIGAFAFPVRILSVTQWKFPVLIASSSVFGGLFITFLIVLFAAFIAQFLCKTGKKNGLGYLTAGLIVFVANLTFGIVYLQIDLQSSGEMRIAAVQHNVQTTEDDYTRFNTAFNMTQEALKNDNVDVIVMPESTAQFLRERDSMKEQLSGLAIENSADIIVGGVNDPNVGSSLSDSSEGSGLVNLGEGKDEDFILENAVHLINAQGELEEDYYVKQKLVPFFENGTIMPFTFFLGNERGVFPTSVGKAGIIVCFESILPETVRDTVREGAEIILEPCNDAYLGHEIRKMHFSQMIFRAMETGRTIVQATTNGITGAVSPDGETLSIPMDVEEVMLFDAKLYDHNTPYVIMGEIWIFVLSGFCVLYAIYLRMKKKHSQSN